MRNLLNSCERIVIKAGTSILTGPDGRISKSHLESLGRGILSLLKMKKEVVLVSSGAIAFGMEAADLRKRPKEMSRLQACAAVGQGKLMHAYEQFFSGQGLLTAQILLTRDDLEKRERFLGARKTLQELFRMKVLPIVNENDTVATEEIAFGDNDNLSVQISHLVGADLLIILSDVDGFYLRDGSRIREVESESEIDATLMQHLRDTKKEKTVGGMRAKLQAARTSMRLGFPLLIVNGREPKVLDRAVLGEDVGTLFWAVRSRKTERQKWIAFSAARKGAVVVDGGAYEVLRTKKPSLLPSGIAKVRGDFERGSVVELENPKGEIFGRGVARYSSRDLQKIAGKKTHEIQGVLGYKYQDEAIHRSDLVVWG